MENIFSFNCMLSSLISCPIFDIQCLPLSGHKCTLLYLLEDKILFSDSGQAATDSRHIKHSNVLTTPHELQIREGEWSKENPKCNYNHLLLLAPFSNPWRHFTCCEHTVKTCFKIALQQLTPLWTLCGSQERWGDE